jgi:hypothetical protein
MKNFGINLLSVVFFVFAAIFVFAGVVALSSMGMMPGGFHGITAVLCFIGAVLCFIFIRLGEVQITIRDQN